MFPTRPAPRIPLPAFLTPVLWSLVLAFPAGAAGPAAASDPLWPLDLDTRYLTSNFMEYRSGRFHAGLDLKTRSRSGFAARAAESGSIVRVRAAASAYGRAVYLLGDSGRTYVYAHLSRFNDDLRSRVRADQYASGTYRTQLYFKENEIRVQRGEVLGLTGESGTGGPHLHFEVRDPDNGPVNPLARGFEVPDEMAPVIHAVRAIPASAGSRIDGGPDAKLLKATDGGGLSGELAGLQISGPVAFAAKIIDASDVAGHKLEPWLIEVRLDGETVYSCRNDRYEFSENSLQRLEWLEVPGIRDRWLHVRPGNSLTGRRGGEWFRGPRGRGLTPGPHELVIEATDFAGNRTTVTLPLLAADMDFPQPAATGAWLVDPVVVGVDSLSGKGLQPLVDVGHEDGVPGDLIRFSPSAGDPVLAPTNLLRRTAPLDAALGRQAGQQGLRGAGPTVEYLAADMPIDAALVVPAPDGAEALADSLPVVQDPRIMVYRWDRKEWKPDGRLLEPARDAAAYRMALSSPGVYAVFRDVQPPVILPGRTPVEVAADPRGRIHGVTLPRWSVFPVPVVDTGSGVAPETITATLDGTPLIVEPDLPRDRVLVELPDDLPPGAHVLRLTVGDEAGNHGEAEVLLDCRE